MRRDTYSTGYRFRNRSRRMRPIPLVLRYRRNERSTDAPSARAEPLEGRAGCLALGLAPPAPGAPHGATQGSDRRRCNHQRERLRWPRSAAGRWKHSRKCDGWARRQRGQSRRRTCRWQATAHRWAVIILVGTDIADSGTVTITVEGPRDTALICGQAGDVVACVDRRTAWCTRIDPAFSCP